MRAGQRLRLSLILMDFPCQETTFTPLIYTMQGPRYQLFWFLETSVMFLREDHLCLIFVVLLLLLNQLLKRREAHFVAYGRKC